MVTFVRLRVNAATMCAILVLMIIRPETKFVEGLGNALPLEHKNRIAVNLTAVNFSTKHNHKNRTSSNVWTTLMPNSSTKLHVVLKNDTSTTVTNNSTFSVVSSTTAAPSSPGSTGFLERRNNLLNTTYRVKSSLNTGKKFNDTSVEIDPNTGTIVSAPKILTILGLFELTRNGKPRPDGKSEKYAAEMAINDINRRQILKNYQLVLQTNDTQCDAGVGIDAFFHALYSNSNKRIISLIGTACSEVTERLAKVVEYWNMVQISFGSTSPSLSDRKEFPLFFRTVSTASSHSEALIALIHHFNWDTVTFFTYNENQYTLPANYLLREVEKANVTCKGMVAFSLSDIRDQLQDMKDLDSRIIIASFSSEMAPQIFCEVYHMGMFGSEYVWILIGKPETSWWLNSESYYSSYKTSSSPTSWAHFPSSSSTTTTTTSTMPSTTVTGSVYYKNRRPNTLERNTFKFYAKRNFNKVSVPNFVSHQQQQTPFSQPEYYSNNIDNSCSPKELSQVVQHTLVVDRYNFITKNVGSISGMKATNFRAKFRRRQLPESPYAPEAYDAVWSLALALKSVHEIHNLSLESFDYNDKNFSTKLMEELSELLFTGISGPLSFFGPDRIGVTSFMQIIGSEMRQIGLYFPHESLLRLNNCSGCSAVEWIRNQVPIARREFRFKIIQVENSLYIIVATLASSGILIALGFLSFNLYNRKLKYIKLSSPKLNNIMIFGCIFAYLAVILLGSDDGPEPDVERFDYMCSIRAYLLSTGFSLAFGSMFAKTYRVHRIFTRSCAGVVKNKLLKDRQLMTLVLALFLIDCVIVSSWSLFDPMYRKLENLTLVIDPSDRSVVYQNQYEVCVSEHAHIWLSILYGYKGLLLVVGLYMAWETRHVKIQALNDSKYIGFCVYIVVLTSVLAVSLANLISERVTVSFLSVTSLILVSTTMTLCLLFLPKIHALVQKRNVGDPVVASLGLKIEFNTRRFMMEDTKELHFRAEVQNRVFKRQIELIDAEIWKTESLLSDQYNNVLGTNGRRISVPSKEQSRRESSTTVLEMNSSTSKVNLPTFHSLNHSQLNSLTRIAISSKFSLQCLQLAQNIQNQTVSLITTCNNTNLNHNHKDESSKSLSSSSSSSSSDENDSSKSEIYTVYLHRPRFIIPISLFSLRNYISSSPNNNNNRNRNILSSIAAAAASALRSSASSRSKRSTGNSALVNNVQTSSGISTECLKPLITNQNHTPIQSRLSNSEPKLSVLSKNEIEHELLSVTKLPGATGAYSHSILKARSSENIRYFYQKPKMKKYFRNESSSCSASASEAGESYNSKRPLRTFFKSPLNFMSGLFYPSATTKACAVPEDEISVAAELPSLNSFSCFVKTNDSNNKSSNLLQKPKYNSVPNLWIIKNSPVQLPKHGSKTKHGSFSLATATAPSFDDGALTATTVGDSLPSQYSYSYSSGNVSSLVEEDSMLKMFPTSAESPFM